VLETGSTTINGPHQGALVDTPDGEWWFFHFQQTQPLGRVVHLQPARWVDGWPLMGVDIDGNGIGEPVMVWTNPDIKLEKAKAPFYPQASDDFSGKKLSLQWQFNHNPEMSAISLSERTGWLTIHPMPAPILPLARNMVTQKQMGYAGTVTTLMDVSQLAEGDRAGLSCFGHLFNGIGVERSDGVSHIYVEYNGKTEIIAPLKVKKIWLRAEMDAKKNAHQLSYSTDGKTFIPCKEAYPLYFGSWKGARVGLYAYSTSEGSAGKAQFDYFEYTITK
jgi:beta-xylosidase